MTDSTASQDAPDRLRLLGAHPRLRALLISSGSLVCGGVVFLVLLGVEIEENGGDLPARLAVLALIDAVIGITAAIAVGPIRDSRAGNLLIVVTAVLSTWALPAWIVSVVRLGSRRSLVLDAVVVLITVCGAFGHSWLRESSAAAGVGELLLIILGSVAAATLVLLWGRVRGTRSALVTALREQAKSAEHARHADALTREADVARARAEERSAIARDMHDGISHQLAIVAMHSGALAYRADLTSDQQRSAADTIRAAAADANVMLRETLTALRDNDAATATEPLPNPSSLEKLFQTGRQAGHDATLEWKNITPAELAQNPQRAVTCVRITEELLMNARKHAPEEPTSMVIEGTPDGVTIRASNPLSPQHHANTHTPMGAGLGLVGVTERAELLGGTARYGLSNKGTFEVEVRLP